MDIMINQSAGFGDIFFCQKIAIKLMELGYKVHWNVVKEYEYIKDYICNGIIWGVETEDKNEMYTLDIAQSTTYFKFENNQELYDNVMQSKYRLADKEFGIGGWENWQDYIKITRNTKEEKELEGVVLKNTPKEFALICNHFATNYLTLDMEIKSDLPTVEITKLKGTPIFSWCGIIEKASEIRIPDSSFPYLVEVLDTTDKLYLYNRNNETNIRTKPIWKKKWEFVE